MLGPVTNGGGGGGEVEVIHEHLSRRTALKGFVATGLTTGLAVAGGLPAPAALAAPPPSSGAGVAAFGPGPAARWLRTAYQVVAAEGLTPPAAARAYAVTCVAVYEAVQPGMPRHRTLAGQLSGLGPLPAPTQRGSLDWPLALNAAAAATLRALFPQAGAASLAAIDAAEAAEVAARREQGVPAAFAEASRRHGLAVAASVAAWAEQDGHAQALARPYTPPVGESLWAPTPPNFGTAIEPYCEQVRPMVLRTTAEVVPAPPVPFSTEPGSAFWNEAMAPYEQSRNNTDDQRDIARFWTDNPRFSGLPAGHWLSIAVQVAEQRRLGLDTTVEALARTAVALHDAFLNCWTWKYRHNLLRPVTYVRRHIDDTWATWVNTPQFPEHTSGHSVASRAAAVVLTDLLGDAPFEDTTLATTVGIAARTRTWSSFTEAADTAAMSRLYGGIHFPRGIEAGKAQGDEVGALVLARLRTRRPASAG
jgi:hypothetical protein